MTRLILVLLMLGTGACSGDRQPTAPTPIQPVTPAPAPAPPPAPTPMLTVTVALTSTTTRQPIGQSVHPVSSLPAQVTLSAPGYITRSTWVTTTAPTVDLFPEQGFDLTFYRQFARNQYDVELGRSGGTPIQPIRVLTQAPAFYMEVGGVKGLSRDVALKLEAVARRLVPAMTAGRFQVTRWETGPTQRAPQPGWIMIERNEDVVGYPAACGRAQVGASAGQIWLSGENRCRLESLFAHELGHALGFWHVSRLGSMMFPVDAHTSGTDAPTDIERHHASLAYARPRGNTDVDVDPRTPLAGLTAMIVD